ARRYRFRSFRIVAQRADSTPGGAQRAASTPGGCGARANAAVPAASSKATVPNTAAKVGTPHCTEADATAPVSHCMTATPRNIAIVYSEIARPAIAAGYEPRASVYSRIE